VTRRRRRRIGAPPRPLRLAFELNAWG